jgi:adenosylcobinamide-GDP ribazoletransferase
MTSSDQQSTNTDPQPLVAASDLWTALSVLTRLPLPKAATPDAHRMGASAWAFPLVGVLLGLICGLFLTVALWIGIHAGIAAALTLGLQMLLTGALHEDGLADTADGLGGGHTKKRALEIMRDSRLGAYGMCTLAITIVGRWAALATIAPIAPIAGLILVAGISRMPMALVMAGMKNARTDGLSHSAGRPDRVQALIALAISIPIALILGGFGGVFAILIALIAPIPIIFWASRKLNGQTGDVLGAVQQIAELALLAIATALFL